MSGTSSSRSRENSPLLGNESNEEDEFDKIDSMPWRYRPAVHRVLPVFTLVQIATYMVNTVRMNWAITMVCRAKYDQELRDSAPVCQTDSIQSKVSEYTALCSLIGGIIGLYMLPRLSHWSDKVGRKKIMGVFLLGDMLSIASMTAIMYFWSAVGYHAIIVSYIITGIFGSSVLITVMGSSYVSDSTRPKSRAIATSQLTACQLVGKAAGPFLSSSLVRATDTLQSTLIAALALDCIAVLYLAFLVPESVLENKPTQQRRQQRSWFSEFNILSPIKSIWTIAKEQHTTIRKNILVLVSIDLLYELIIAGRAGIAVLYPQMQFNWTSIEIGYLQSATALMRIFLLVLVIPQVISLLHKVFNEEESAGLSKTELCIMRVGNMLEVVGYTGYGVSWNAAAYVASSFIATSGVIAKPTVQSALLNLVPKDQIGEFLGAKGVLDGLTSIVFSSVGLSFYSFTVTRWPELIFYLSALGYFIVILLTLKITT